MKSGGPWNLRGLRPETREAARDAARRSGMSVGEWLNNVIQQDEDDDHGEPMRRADYDDEDDDGWRDDARREPRRDVRREPRRRPHYEDHEPPRRRRREREVEIEREAALAREEFGEVHARLDRLTHQLERMARTDAPRLSGAPVPPRGRQHPPRPREGIRAPGNGPSSSSTLPSPKSPNASARFTATARSLLPFLPRRHRSRRRCRRLRHSLKASNRCRSRRPSTSAIWRSNCATSRRGLKRCAPSNELEKVIKTFRKDLTEIREQLTEALPRRAVESLEIEVQALTQRHRSLPRFRRRFRRVGRARARAGRSSRRAARLDAGREPGRLRRRGASAGAKGRPDHRPRRSGGARATRDRDRRAARDCVPRGIERHVERGRRRYSRPRRQNGRTRARHGERAGDVDAGRPHRYAHPRDQRLGRRRARGAARTREAAVRADREARMGSTHAHRSRGAGRTSKTVSRN